MAKPLPIEERLVKQLARATIKTIVDGIVELVTNSDDSYRRMELSNQEHSGEITIVVDRQKGGTCKELIVRDSAEGMCPDDLERAIVFGGATSGFECGQSVRGFFGRGLKETIIALGEGRIITIRDGLMCQTRLWWDDQGNRPLYDDALIRNTQRTNEPNGTTVEITIRNEKIKIPELKKFTEQVSRHFALRDILNRRKVYITFNDLKRNTKTTRAVTFEVPHGKEVFAGKVLIEGFDDEIVLRLFESTTALESPRNNPYGRAGVLIKTEGAILDNQLFKFESDPAGSYFFGWADCPGVARRLRQGETEIVDPNRNGLEWRHEYCQALQRSIEGILETHVSRKRASLQAPPRKVKESTRKMLRKLCSLLNSIAKQELEDLPAGSLEADPHIEELTLKPVVANIPPGQPRTFSVYAPTDAIEQFGPHVRIRSDSRAVRILASQLVLHRHPRYPMSLYYRPFKVLADAPEGSEAVITATLGTQTAEAVVRVMAQKKARRGQLSGRKRGFITDIIADEMRNPPQRAVYRDGIIRVYCGFPAVSTYVGPGLRGVEKPEGRMLLAELIGEAFCKELARRGIEIGKYPCPSGSEIDAYNTAVNDLQKRYLHLIQDLVFKSTLT